MNVSVECSVHLVCVDDGDREQIWGGGNTKRKKNVKQDEA